MPTIATLSADVAELRAEVARLQTQLDGVRVIKQRRPQPEGEPCVLGNEPTDCGNASVYRYQRGCKGVGCLDKNSEYYAKNRDAKAAKNGTKVEAPKRAPAKKAAPVAKKAAPVKKPVPSKRVAKT